MGDEALTVRHRVGFEEFYRSGYGHVFRVVWALAGSSVAEELTQEAFLRAHGRWSEVVDLDDPLAWVKRVARNLAISRFRRLAAEAKAVARFGRPRVLSLSEEALDVWAAVRSLPPRQREAVVLCYVEGLSRVEAAIEMGVSSETVKTHLERARSALSDQLEDLR